ncbi:hypothetical protein [Natronococcus roseus]|uniref:hypothetical protein n=1 Tax=Natronococcus roseus TaxID=1052014 RepID=UPI00374DB83A
MAEEGEGETVYISEEEAADIFSGQITVYQHIQDQALSVVRSLLAFFGIAIAALSIFITNFSIQFDPFLPVYNPDIVDSAFFTLVVLFSTVIVILGSILLLGELYDGIKIAISILSAPKLKPFSEQDTHLKVSKKPHSATISQYESWIKQNQNTIDEHSSDLTEVYNKLQFVIIGSSILLPVGFITYFFPDLLLFSLSLLPAIVAFWIAKKLLEATNTGQKITNRINPVLIYFLITVPVATLTYLILLDPMIGS